jgi:histidinol-phosphate aminotransferase
MSQAKKASKFVAQLEEYRITSQDCWKLPDGTEIIKADWNESGAVASPHITKKLAEFIAGKPLHWYPDVEATQLRTALSAYANLPFDHIQVFNGSDAALEYLARAFIDPNDEVIIRIPTYDNFRVYVESCGAKIVEVIGKSAFTMEWKPILNAVTAKTKLIYLVNPDNPTGVTYSHSQIKELLNKAKHALVIIDEAYFEFYGETAASLIEKYPNLVVSRSFSKAWALAGVRCGYFLAHPEVLGVINKIRVGKNVNSLAQIAALAALEDQKYMEAYVAEVRQAKTWLVKKMAEIGVDVIDTPANFVIIQTDRPTELASHLKNNRIYVRDRSYFPQLERSVRVTIGTQEQAEILARVIENYSELQLFFQDQI